MKVQPIEFKGLFLHSLAKPWFVLSLMVFYIVFQMVTGLPVFIFSVVTLVIYLRHLPFDNAFVKSGGYYEVNDFDIKQFGPDGTENASYNVKGMKPIVRKYGDNVTIIFENSYLGNLGGKKTKSRCALLNISSFDYEKVKYLL